MTDRISPPPRRVYAVTGVPPEIQAYAMAKYSRSSQSMIDSISELSAQRAEHFLNTFYFQYGHRSIADLAHLNMAVEQISILAAVKLVDEPLWDGQERSTRYQPFRKTGYFIPGEIAGTEVEQTYRDAADALFEGYDRLAKRLTNFLVGEIPAPTGADPKAHERTLRARAFDVARFLLPIATNTSVGQVVSARVVERQICRLLADRFPEVRALGADIKQACLSESADPLRQRVNELAGTLDSESGDALRGAAESGPVAPTLVKYTRADEYGPAVCRQVAALVEQHLPFLVADPWRTLSEPAVAGLPADQPLNRPDRLPEMGRVRLAPAPVNSLDELAAALVYRVVRDASYVEVLRAVQKLPQRVTEMLVEPVAAARGPHDEQLREARTGYRLAFDILMDYGSFRDLHRHRRCVQLTQELTWLHGFDPASVVFPLAFGRDLGERALERGLAGEFEESLRDAGERVARMAAHYPDVAPYLLPLGYRQRSLFKMDDAELAYIVEQRTAPAGHFSYRSIAYQLWQATQAQHPALTRAIRVINPHETVDLLTR